MNYTLTSDSTTVFIAAFVVIFISSAAVVISTNFMRLLAVLLAMFGVDVEG